MHNEREGMPVTALREIKILKALRHPCIVDLLDMFVVRSKFKISISSRTPLFIAEHVRFDRSGQRFSVVCVHGLSVHGS